MTLITQKGVSISPYCAEMYDRCIINPLGEIMLSWITKTFRSVRIWLANAIAPADCKMVEPVTTFGGGGGNKR